MSKFQEIKHLYSYGIQTCLTRMHFHQDLRVFVDLGFKMFWAVYGDSQWVIHAKFIFARTKITRVICIKDPLAWSVPALSNLEWASRAMLPSLNESSPHCDAIIRVWMSRPAHVLAVFLWAFQTHFLTDCASKVALTYGSPLQTKQSVRTSDLKAKPRPASADGLVW